MRLILMKNSVDLLALLLERAESAGLAQPGDLDDLRRELETARALDVDPRRPWFVERARETFNEDGVLEIDDEAVVSFGENGAYVEAWAWVSDLEGKTKPQNEREDTPPSPALPVGSRSQPPR